MNTPAYFCLDQITTYSLGVKNVPATSIAKVYPNPAADFVNIELTDASVTQVTLMDRSGRIIATPAIEPKMHIPLTGLPSGTYLLQFSSASGRSASMRITKQ